MYFLRRLQDGPGPGGGCDMIRWSYWFRKVAVLVRADDLAVRDYGVGVKGMAVLNALLFSPRRRCQMVLAWALKDIFELA